MGKLILTGKGRRWLRSGHPWVYADDIADGDGEPGELVPVEEPGGALAGWGLHSTSSRIRVRMVTRSKEQPDRAFWKERVARAIATRERMGLLDPRDACRLLAGDADGIPGLVVDRYADALVLQSSIQGSDRMLEFLLELVLECLPFEPGIIVDRSDTNVRKLESLERRVEILKGSADAPLVVEEGDLEYEVDLLEGQKTGHYLDQRVNRRRAAGLARGRHVLDAFSYDGLFGIRAALAGAESVLCIDQSKEAGERLMRNAERNGVLGRIEFQRANAMSELRARSLGPQRYGLVIVDPPAFARNRRELSGAERGYVELNRRAIALSQPGGHLVSASCSYNVRAEQFLRFLSSAAWDAGREVYLEALLTASVDHPVLLTLPESHYLKCAFLRVS